MPVKLGTKKYKTFNKAASAIAKKNGISIKRAKAYVATVERARGKIPGKVKRKR